MTNREPNVEPLRCGCATPHPWPPKGVPDAPRPTKPDPPADQDLHAPPYNLRGPQVEPTAAFWTMCQVPCVVGIEDLARRTDNPDDECYFPPYPAKASVVRDEIDELVELASLRDDPGAVYSNESGRRRRQISPLLQARPQPLGAVVNIERDPVLGSLLAGRQPPNGAIEIARGRQVSPAYRS